MVQGELPVVSRAIAFLDVMPALAVTSKLHLFFMSSDDDLRLEERDGGWALPAQFRLVDE